MNIQTLRLPSNKWVRRTLKAAVIASLTLFSMLALLGVYITLPFEISMVSRVDVIDRFFSPLSEISIAQSYWSGLLAIVPIVGSVFCFTKAESGDPPAPPRPPSEASTTLSSFGMWLFFLALGLLLLSIWIKVYIDSFSGSSAHWTASDTVTRFIGSLYNFLFNLSLAYLAMLFGVSATQKEIAQ